MFLLPDSVSLSLLSFNFVIDKKCICCLLWTSENFFFKVEVHIKALTGRPLYMLSHGTSIACSVLVRTGTVICSTVCDLFPCVSFVVGNRSLWFSSYAWIIYYCNVGGFCVYIKNVILIESLFHCFISLLYSWVFYCSQIHALLLDLHDVDIQMQKCVQV